MRKFELFFADGEVEKKISELESELPIEDENKGWLGVLDGEELALLAKIMICLDRKESFCKSCGISCETGCPLHHFIQVIGSLGLLLENRIQYRLNVWPNGKITYHKGFVAQVDEHVIEIMPPWRNFAYFNEPSLPDEGTRESRLLSAVFAGQNPVPYLEKYYLKKK